MDLTAYTVSLEVYLIRGPTYQHVDSISELLFRPKVSSSEQCGNADLHLCRCQTPPIRQFPCPPSFSTLPVGSAVLNAPVHPPPALSSSTSATATAFVRPLVRRAEAQNANTQRNNDNNNDDDDNKTATSKQTAAVVV